MSRLRPERKHLIAALAVRAGQAKLSDVPEADRALVRQVLRTPSALIAAAREERVVTYRPHVKHVPATARVT